jgi:putative transposase
VDHPADHRGSSDRANAPSEAEALVTPHESYRDLGLTAARRQAADRERFRSDLEPRRLDPIRQASNGHFALGRARFADEMAAALGRRVTPGKIRPTAQAARTGIG